MNRDVLQRPPAHARLEIGLAIALLLASGMADAGPRELSVRVRGPTLMPQPTILQVSPWHCRRWTAFEVRGTGYVTGSRIWMQYQGASASLFQAPTTYQSPGVLLGRVPLSCAPGTYMLAVKNGARSSNMSYFIVEPD